MDRFDVVVGRGVGEIGGRWEQRHLRVEAVVGKKRGESGGGVLPVVIRKLLGTRQEVLGTRQGRIRSNLDFCATQPYSGPCDSESWPSALPNA